MDAITLLKEEHKQVARMFREFEKSQDADEGRELAASILTDLRIHAEVEEAGFYPVVRAELPDEAAAIREAHEEHHVMELLIQELSDLPTDDETYAPKMTVLKELVEHHVREEEDEVFPKVRKLLGRNRLAEIGEELLAIRAELSENAGASEASSSAQR